MGARCSRSPRCVTWRALATACLAAALSPAFALDPGVLIQELQLPKIALNLNVTFATSDLRIPDSLDPEGDVVKVQEELKAGERPDLWLRLARLQQQLGRYDDAATSYQKAAAGYDKLLQAEPQNARARVGYAEVLVALSRDEDAATQIELAMVADETLWKPHELAADLHAKHAVMAHSLNMAQLMRSHLDAAEAEAKEALRLAPDDPRPQVMLFIAKWLPEVLELRADPKSGLKRLGAFEEMSEILKKAAALAPGFPRLAEYAVSAKMMPFFTSQMSGGLDKPLWDGLDDAQRRVLTSCRDDYLRLSEQIPSLKAEALTFAAVACFSMADKKSMYEHLRAAADADPKSTTALEVMVGFLAQEGNWAQALLASEEIKTRKPNGRSYTWLGRIYAEQRQWKAAEEAFRTATSYDDSSSAANLGLGVVLLKQGASPVEALLPLQTAWEKSQNEPEVLLAWGTCLALLGEVDEGRRMVKQAISMWPRSEGLQRVAKELGLEAQ